MSSVEIHQWVTKGQELLVRIASIMEEAPSPKIRSLSARLPRNMTPADGAASVVFAGQYSGGKSSIIKAMTGRGDIEVGSGIVTQQVHEYDWNGITVVDTPGVHTEIRPDHDAIAYKAISDADLLVFVVTNELFDSHLADHFRKVIVERDKAHEAMLVVNKMRRCAGGNTAAAHAVIREDLRKVLAPFSPEKLRTSFVDAEAAIDAQLESDPEIAHILREKSGFASFTDGLNEFVRQQGLSSQYTTALYAAEQTLLEARVAESAGDPDVDGVQELLLQKRHVLLGARDQLRRSIDNQVQRASSTIREIGRKSADLIHAGADKEEVNRQLRDAQTRVEKCTKKLAEDVQEMIGREMTELGHRVAQITESVVAKELLLRLENLLPTDDPERPSSESGAADVTKQLGAFLVKHSFNSKSRSFAGLFRLDQYSGTATHGAVKGIGHFFGKSFKPWEAVKWARVIGNAGRVLAVVGTVLNVVLQIKEDADARKQEADLRAGRDAVRTGFSEVARRIETQFDQAGGTFISQTVGRRLEEVDRQLEELNDMQRARSDLAANLMEALHDTRMLIREMHGRGRDNHNKE